MSGQDELSEVVFALPIAVMVIGAQGRITHASPSVQALFGPVLVGRPYGMVLRQPELLQAVERAVSERCSGTLRMTRPGAAGDVVYEVQVSPLPKGVLCAFRDLTEAAQVDQMRREFVANVSHELRTPLTALSGLIETLQGPARDDPVGQARFLSMMAAETERMSRLVDDLLHLSRVEAEERVRPTSHVDLGVISREAVDLMMPMARAAQVRLELQVPDALPPVRADRDQMVQVIQNLVENAVKYGSRPGGLVRLELEITGVGQAEWLNLMVTDEGEGIAPHHLPRLTERFYRVDGHRSRAQGGTGLGLAIVKHIANRHRGRLIIESTEGKGSRFTLRLPVGENPGLS